MSYRILVVEDSDTERHVITQCLKKAGMEVLEASEAEGGLKLARSEKPDLIVMDIVLPGMSGFQAIRKLRGYEETAKTPVVVVSTKGEKVDLEWGRRQGANEYLVKPVNCRTLQETVNKLLD